MAQNSGGVRNRCGVDSQDRFRIEEKDPKNELTLKDLLLLVLTEGPKTFAQLRTALPSIDPKTLSVYLDRLKKRGKLSLKEGL